MVSIQTDAELREQIRDLKFQSSITGREEYFGGAFEPDLMDKLVALIKARDAAKEREVYDKGWAYGWAQRGSEEDHSALIGKLKAMKPQDGAFFLIGEIERAARDMKVTAKEEKSGDIPGFVCLEEDDYSQCM